MLSYIEKIKTYVIHVFVCVITICKYTGSRLTCLIQVGVGLVAGKVLDLRTIGFCFGLDCWCGGRSSLFLDSSVGILHPNLGWTLGTDARLG